MKKKILIISTGGTLSSVKSEKGLIPGLSSQEILSELKLVSRDSELYIEELLSLDSANIFPEDWAALARKIADASKEYDGITIIHGTDTLAYTSSMLSFMLPNISIPVIVTGSQLSISHPVADALENCRCAIYMAACGYPGVFVAFNRKVMLGCRASKVRSLSFDAFDSINYPNVAEISSLGLHVNRDALKVPTGDFKLEPDYSEEVFLLKLYPGIKAKIILKLYQQGYRGIYIEGYGLGGVPFLKHDFITAISQVTEKGMIVVIGSQCRYEGSNLSVYETGRLAVESGALEAYDMTSEAAITKLMWTLGQTGDADEVRKYFSRNMVGEVHIPTTIK
ncbi:MAG: asparaginase [Eubacteriales bacterium]|nr:asparaginase [Eubacteriales bacterium]MDD4390838.1 asparaginase [Eubacteriales bacterium]